MLSLLPNASAEKKKRSIAYDLNKNHNFEIFSLVLSLAGRACLKELPTVRQYSS